MNLNIKIKNDFNIIFLLNQIRYDRCSRQNEYSDKTFYK